MLKVLHSKVTEGSNTHRLEGLDASGHRLSAGVFALPSLHTVVLSILITGLESYTIVGNTTSSRGLSM
jgi:hypothetical protein